MTRSFFALSALSALSALVRALSLFTGTVRAVRALFILGREMRPSAGRINNPSDDDHERKTMNEWERERI